jgi:hypothetical protein
MISKTFRFGFRELGLTNSSIVNILGCNDDDRDFITDLTGKLMSEASAVSDIKAEYRIYDNIQFDQGTKSLIVNNHLFNTGSIIYNQVRKSESIAFFMCTAGDAIGKRSRVAMSEKDLLSGYIYDVIGSEIVEAAADLMQSEIESSCLPGKKITNRYSPGYCGWNVSQQHELFDLFSDNFCGIKLTDSALMDPVKSVSGIIGIGKDVRRMAYTCGICNMNDCIYRRVRAGKNPWYC